MKIQRSTLREEQSEEHREFDQKLKKEFKTDGVPVAKGAVVHHIDPYVDYRDAFNCVLINEFGQAAEDLHRLITLCQNRHIRSTGDLIHYLNSASLWRYIPFLDGAMPKQITFEEFLKNFTIEGLDDPWDYKKWNHEDIVKWLQAFPQYYQEFLNTQEEKDMDSLNELIRWITTHPDLANKFECEFGIRPEQWFSFYGESYIKNRSNRKSSFTESAKKITRELTNSLNENLPTMEEHDVICTYKVVWAPLNGDPTPRAKEFKASSLEHAVKKLAEHLWLCVEPEDIEDAHDALEEIAYHNGDGCDLIISFENTDTGEEYIWAAHDDEDWDDDLDEAVEDKNEKDPAEKDVLLADENSAGEPDKVADNTDQIKPGSGRTFQQWFDDSYGTIGEDDDEFYPFDNYVKSFPNAECLRDATAEDIIRHAHEFYDIWPVDSDDRISAFRFASDELGIDENELSDAWLDEIPIEW